MGPAAWAAVGRALGVAVASSALNGQNNLAVVTARSIHSYIQDNELKMAEAMLRDLAFRHRDSFREFMCKYKDELPPEFIDEFADFL